MISDFKNFKTMPLPQKIVFILSVIAMTAALVFLMLDWARVVPHGDYVFIPCMGADIILQGIMNMMRKQKGAAIFSLILGLFVMAVYATHMLRLAVR